MSDNVHCFSSLLVVLIGIGAFLYLGKSCSAHSREKRDSAQEGYLRAQTVDQKIVFFVFNLVWLIFVGGFWGFLAACSVALVSVVAAICGNNPWPYIYEMWRDIMDARSDQGMAPGNTSG